MSRKEREDALLKLSDVAFHVNKQTDCDQKNVTRHKIYESFSYFYLLHPILEPEPQCQKTRQGNEKAQIKAKVSKVNSFFIVVFLNDPEKSKQYSKRQRVKRKSTQNTVLKTNQTREQREYCKPFDVGLE